jgi:hypothetical protein
MQKEFKKSGAYALMQKHENEGFQYIYNFNYRSLLTKDNIQNKSMKYAP